MSAPTYTRAGGLTLAQQNAVDLLASGLNDRAAAERLGLARETITRWRNYDPSFQVALNQRRADFWGSAADAVRASLPIALDTIREQLDIGPRRDRLALDLLTRTGLLGPQRSRARGVHSPFDPLAVGPLTLEELLDEEVRKMRAAGTAAPGADGRPVPVDAPITEADREAAYRRLQALLEDEADNEPTDPLTSPPPITNSHIQSQESHVTPAP